MTADAEPDTPSKPADPVKPGEMDYETFQNLKPADQQAYMESFNDIEAFFDWYNAAKEAYDKAHPSIEVGGNGTIDMEQIMGGNN